MMILGLVRNYIPSYNWVINGGWNIADCVSRSYDVEGMHIGTVAAGHHFRLLALSCADLRFRTHPSYEEIEQEVRKFALQEATLVGIYRR